MQVSFFIMKNLILWERAITEVCGRGEHGGFGVAVDWVDSQERLDLEFVVLGGFPTGIQPTFASETARWPAD